MDFLSNIPNSTAEVILSLAIILFSGFLMTRMTKKLKLPDVTGYILSGVLIGPYVLRLIPPTIIKGMDFVTDIALAYIAFSVGKYFKISHLRKSGKKMILITLLESLTAAVFVTLTMIFVFHLSVPFSLLLGSISSATAPASTIMTIRQYKAKGELIDTILQVVALDDAVALIAFSICAAIASEMDAGSTKIDWSILFLPLLFNFLMLILGFLCGILLKWIITESRTRENRLILVNAVIFALTGICTMLDISPLLSCMVMGTVYVNIIDNKNLFKQVNHFTPPIMLMFFVLSGMRLNVPMLLTSGIIGVCYFIVRILGKYLGAYIGCVISHTSNIEKKYLGLALIPQAGVSIGLAALGQRILPPKTGSLLSTIILSSGILYEIVGPVCAKIAIFQSGSISEPTSKQSHITNYKKNSEKTKEEKQNKNNPD